MVERLIVGARGAAHVVTYFADVLRFLCGFFGMTLLLLFGFTRHVQTEGRLKLVLV